MLNPSNALFNERTIKRLCSGTSITPKQKQSSKDWLSLLKSGLLTEEKSNYFKFAIYVLQDILGYPVKEKLDFEKGNVEFSFRNSNGVKGVCIEVKGTGTKDLFSSQHRTKIEHETPIKQTWDYMGSGDFDYGISTNYNTFVLIDRSKGYSKYHVFNFVDIETSDAKLMEFVAIFSKRNILDTEFIPKLFHESVTEEREFTKQFYKLYHETRLMLIKEFQANVEVSKHEAVHFAQLFLNRLVFLFFAEDNGRVERRLFKNTILESINPQLVSEFSHYVCDTIINLFERLDKGSTRPVEIYGFNGGLFSEKIPQKIYFSDLRDESFFKELFQFSSLKKQTYLDEYTRKVTDQFSGSLNPIVSNLLTLSSFDFQSELNVNILGHIFEQSLNDLEGLLEDGTIPARKREGIVYTPEYITDYICRNTIIPYLSKNNATSVIDLIKEYERNITELEDKFRQIKIIDPACGSGAFLIKSIDILLEIYKEIQIIKESKGEYIVTRKKKSGMVEEYTLKKWNEEEEARKIIENNIYGVDINEESVEITRLSLFLKIASNNRKLIDLTGNIKVGNTLIDDESLVDQRPFNWQKEFKSVLDNGGFNIVIGNPPYLRIQGLHESHDSATKFFEENYLSASGRYDYYVLFLEKGPKLLKKNGYQGFIIPHKFINSGYGSGIRKFLSQHLLIHKFLSFGHNFVFEGVTTYTAIVILKKSKNDKFLYHHMDIKKNDSIENAIMGIDNTGFTMIDQTNLNETPWILQSDTTSTILDKIKLAGPNIMEYFDFILQGLISGDDSIYFLRVVKDNGLTLIVFSEKLGKQIEIEKEILKPILFGEDVKRYGYIGRSNYYVIYPYEIVDGEQRVMQESEFRRKFPLAYSYLFEFRDYLTSLKKKFKTNPKYWYSLHRGRRKEWFEMEKIIAKEISLGCNMTLDKNKFFHVTTVYSFFKKAFSQH